MKIYLAGGFQIKIKSGRETELLDLFYDRYKGYRRLISYYHKDEEYFRGLMEIVQNAHISGNVVRT